MRIISGKYKGQQLNEFVAPHIRPTTDRVKESLFNILQGQIPHSRVLDLFSGTGNLGIEALSRGADHVTFVENHPQSLEILKKNILKLKISESHQILSKDVRLFLQKPQSLSENPSSTAEPLYDLIFADPPFTEAMADEVMTLMSHCSLFGPETLMAIESAKKEKLEPRYHGSQQTLFLSDQRKFGDKILSFFSLETSKG